MTDTPLSDAKVEHADTGSPESYERFLVLFRDSTVGIVGVGLPEPVTGGRVVAGGHVVADGGIGAGRTSFGDGRPRLLAFADPESVLDDPGRRFNAGLSGEVLLRMAAADPECEGILVNCAVREISMIISKSTAEALLAPTAADTATEETAAGKTATDDPAMAGAPRRPWWKRR
jgi:hypothetical protein